MIGRFLIPALLITVLQTVSLGDESLADQKLPSDTRQQAVGQRPSKEAINAVASVLTDEDEDFEIRQQTLITYLDWRFRFRILPPRSLMTGLLSQDEKTRRLVADAVSSAKRFPCDCADIVAKAANSEDPYVALAVSHMFVDVERLQKLSLNEDGEVRSLAVARLWDATEDVTLVLPLLWTQSDISAPEEWTQLEARLTDERKTAAETNSQEQQDLSSLPVDDPLSEVRRKLCVNNLRSIGIALKLHTLTIEHADEVVPFCLSRLSDESDVLRKRAATSLLMIVAEKGDSLFENSDAAPRIRSRLDIEANAGIKESLKKILLELEKSRIDISPINWWRPALQLSSPCDSSIDWQTSPSLQFLMYPSSGELPSVSDESSQLIWSNVFSPSVNPPAAPPHETTEHE
ncbi:MAG TPA: hypothetical protein PLR25_24190 [Planctomycetaceae bacterium]|nr:hypothetical protein [Planctomycetaceae bacterium]